MIYFTIAKNECGYLIDSISDCYEVLKAKFPDEKIYKSDKAIVSIYVIKDELDEYGKDQDNIEDNNSN